jgi:REP element-mobilizing transposase RayT
MNYQYSLEGNDFKRVTQFGGELNLGKRKGRRPLALKKPMHVTLRAEEAKGAKSFLRHKNLVTSLLRRLSREWCVRVYHYSINSNHLHLVVMPKTREGFQNFFRVLTGLLARKITGAERGKALKKRFFDLIIFSRIVEWGKAFRTMKNYVWKNQLEAEGLISYTPRGKTKARAPTAST